MGLDASRLAWYARRAAGMSPAEVIWRGRDQALKTAWRPRQVRAAQAARLAGAASGLGPATRFATVLPAGTAGRVPEQARQALLAAADRLMDGEWELLGVVRTDLAEPDWFYDPVTRRRAVADGYSFGINHRSEAATGNVKQVWELSRLQHLTLLASAYFVSRDERYARRAGEQLRSWWRASPFLTGVHWTSGIEIGIRLISFTWIRRLLDPWPAVADYFERDALATRQIRWHQQYLAAFRSRGSSANNHVIAEAAGQLVASCAFPWFRESGRWRARSAVLLEQELEKNTFPSGIGRELASDYQCFVAELVLLAAVEAEAAGLPLSAAAWDRLAAMLDSGAALLDQRLRPPRQGDGDEGRALLLDAPAFSRWPSMLALGESLIGRSEWWPVVPQDAASVLIAAMPGAERAVTGRPGLRPWHFDDAGTTLLRTARGSDPEIWCRCDGGPHGFLKIAAHAHADALSVEVRYGGVDVLADPGTYCYHGEPDWRSYFRSTIAHNTVELAGRSQASEAGPFLWLQHANAHVLSVRDIGDAVEWTAEHDGYRTLATPATHRRCVRLDRASRTIDIVDEIIGGCHRVRLALHFGPEVHAELDGNLVTLRWPAGLAAGGARMELPQSLDWSLHRGETSPILGWYSTGLGRRTPAYTIIGHGTSAPDEPLTTRLEFVDTGNTTEQAFNQRALSWSTADTAMFSKSTNQAEAG